MQGNTDMAQPYPGVQYFSPACDISAFYPNLSAFGSVVSNKIQLGFAAAKGARQKRFGLKFVAAVGCVGSHIFFKIAQVRQRPRRGNSLRSGKVPGYGVRLCWENDTIFDTRALFRPLG